MFNKISNLPEGLSSEHICSARSLTPREVSPILSGCQPWRRLLQVRIWTTAEIRSCRNCEKKCKRCKPQKFLFCYLLFNSPLYSPQSPVHRWHLLVLQLYCGTSPRPGGPVPLLYLAGCRQERRSVVPLWLRRQQQAAGWSSPCLKVLPVPGPGCTCSDKSSSQWSLVPNCPMWTGRDNMKG